MSDITIAFLDVGHGDATLAVDHQAMLALLLDCPVRQHQRVLEALREFGGPRLTTILATHSHLDHLNGAVDVLADLSSGCDVFHANVDTYLNALPAEPDPARPGRLRAPPQARALFSRLLERSSPELSRLHRGDSGRVGSIRWHAVAPHYEDLVDAVVRKNPNLGSAMLVLEADGHRVVVGGDACSRAIRRVIDSGDLGCEVLRWPHHGKIQTLGEPVSDEELLAAASPEVAVFSVGSRTLNDRESPHPPEPTLLATRTFGAGVLCTQLNNRCAAGSCVAATPCAGDIRVRIVDGDLTVAPKPVDHRSRVSVKYPRPACV